MLLPPMEKWCYVKVCDQKVGGTMKSQLEQHTRSAVHNKNKQLRSAKKQTLLTQMQTDSPGSEFDT